MNDPVVPLKEYIEALLREKDLRDQQRYDAQDKAVRSAMEAAEKAVVKAENAANKRFEGINEFREAYKDIIAQQIPRAEAEQRFTMAAEKHDALVLQTTRFQTELLVTLGKLQEAVSSQRARSAAYAAGTAAAVTIMTAVMLIIAFVRR